MLSPPTSVDKSPKLRKKFNNIKVFARIRPQAQQQPQQTMCVQQVNRKQLMFLPTHRDNFDKIIFRFNKVFGAETTQEEVYDNATDNILNNVFEGINGTILCYGQTSSGKTYTCIGEGLVIERQRGILPRSISQMFDRISGKPRNVQCRMSFSMIEIYNEKIRDMLDPHQHDLKIRENKSQGIFVSGAAQKYLLSEGEAYSLIQKGIDNRAVGCTNMNAHSSRSHMMCIIRLHQHDLYTGQGKVAKLIMVDLAGCEKLSRTGSEGKQFEEAKKVNTSLSMLGKVISILSEGKQKHVPYRDSKLTRLLQESLGGNCITSLIINISPIATNEVECLQSLKFGCRAQSITNEPRVNKQYTVSELLSLLSKAEQTISQQNSIISNMLKQQSPDENDPELRKFLKSFNQENESKTGSMDWAKRRKDISYDHFIFKDVSECLDSADYQSVEDEDTSIRRVLRNSLSAKCISSSQFMPDKSTSLSDVIEAVPHRIGPAGRRSSTDLQINEGWSSNLRMFVPPLESEHTENESEEDNNSEGTKKKTEGKISTRRRRSERPTKQNLVICQADGSSTQGIEDKLETRQFVRQKLGIQSAVSVAMHIQKKLINETACSSSNGNSKNEQSTACQSQDIRILRQQVERDLDRLNILDQSTSIQHKSSAVQNIQQIRKNMRRLARLKERVIKRMPV